MRELYGDDESRGQYPGVDISFEDLSLSIKVGDDVIDVVDKVTGRIRAKTMTALMGGSGAGKVYAS
jgi:ABC-type dipeptide/oligopeptide/nickel transport system ATPase component